MFATLAALVVFFAVSVLTALAHTLSGLRTLDAHLAAFSLACGAFAGTGAFVHVWYRRTERRTPVLRRRVSPWGWIVFALFALFAVRSFCWLVYARDKHLAIGSPNNLGDLSMHMQHARYFASGAAWWPEHPEAANQPLRYYPGINLFQSLLLLVGADELQALTWVGLIGSAAAAAALYRWGGSFTVAGFLFSGGVAGFQVITQFAPLTDFQADLAWKSLPLAVFVTQRPFLFALPAGLLLLIHWKEKFFTDPPPAFASHARSHFDPSPSPPASRPGPLPFWVELVLYATMPLFHLFAFAFLSLLLGWWFVAYGLLNRRTALRAHLIWLVLLAFAPATLFIAEMTSFFTAASDAIHVHWWWMRETDQPGKPSTPFLLFWWRNFGLFALLAPALWVFTVGEFIWSSVNRMQFPGSNEEQDAGTAFVLPAGALFVVTTFVMFASWDWDNTKIMLWCYVAFLPFLWQRWIRPLAAPLRWPLCALLFFSGAVSLLGGLDRTHMGYTLVDDREELDLVRAAVRELPVEGYFASAPAYNHPLVYCGRKLALGYEGHVSSQSIDVEPLKRDLDLLMLGTERWEKAARRLGVRYIYWGPRETQRWPVETHPWERDRAPIAKGDWGRIYDLDAPVER